MLETKFAKTVNYRIENLELRLYNINKDTMGLKQEIVKWVKWEPANGEIKTPDEYCYTIAHFTYDGDGYPELRYVGSRPIELTPGEQAIFMELVKEGYKYKISQFPDNYAEQLYEKYL
jgi:hypothetical protein